MASLLLRIASRLGCFGIGALANRANPAASDRRMLLPSHLVATLALVVGAAARADTIITFSDPALNGSTPMFTFNDALNQLTGGWSGTNLTLLTPRIAAPDYPNARFTMSPVSCVFLVGGNYTTGPGLITFLDSSNAPVLIISFTGGLFSTTGSGGSDFIGYNVVFSGPLIGAPVSNEAFAFSFANRVSTSPPGSFTATAAFTCSASGALSIGPPQAAPPHAETTQPGTLVTFADPALTGATPLITLNAGLNRVSGSWSGSGLTLLTPGLPAPDFPNAKFSMDPVACTPVGFALYTVGSGSIQFLDSSNAPLMTISFSSAQLSTLWMGSSRFQANNVTISGPIVPFPVTSDSFGFAFANPVSASPPGSFTATAAFTCSGTGGCGVSPGSPSSGAVLTFPTSFTWTAAGNCAPKSLGFATSTNPAVIHFRTQTSGATISQSYWNSVVAQLGPAPTYFWTVGDASGSTFIPQAPWRPFTINTGCVPQQQSPAHGAAVTFPATFSWSSPQGCTSQCLGFSLSPGGSLVFWIPHISGGSVSQASWSTVVEVLGSFGPYYWSVGACGPGGFARQSDWRPFNVYRTGACCRADGTTCTPGMTFLECLDQGGIRFWANSDTCFSCGTSSPSVAYIYVPIHGQIAAAYWSNEPLELPPWMSTSWNGLRTNFDLINPTPPGAGLVTRELLEGDWREKTKPGIRKILDNKISAVLSLPLGTLGIGALLDVLGRLEASKASGEAATDIEARLRERVEELRLQNAAVFVDLVGASRGGAVAAEVLRKLHDPPIPQTFYSLTLLDAIDPDGFLPSIGPFAAAGNLLGDPVIDSANLPDSRVTNYVAENGCCGFWAKADLLLAPFGYPKGRIRTHFPLAPVSSQVISGSTHTSLTASDTTGIDNMFAATAGVSSNYASVSAQTFSLAFSTRVGQMLRFPLLPIAFTPRGPGNPFGPRGPGAIEYVADPSFTLTCQVVSAAGAALATPGFIDAMSEYPEVIASLNSTSVGGWPDATVWQRTQTSATCAGMAARIAVGETVWQHLDPDSLTQSRVRLRVRGTLLTGGAGTVTLNGDGLSQTVPLVGGVGGAFEIDQIVMRSPRLGTRALDSIAVTGGMVDLTLVSVGPGCRADFDGNGVLGVSDIFVFLSAWFAADPRADFDDTGGVPNVSDIFAFLTAWFARCP